MTYYSSSPSLFYLYCKLILVFYKSPMDTLSRDLNICLSVSVFVKSSHHICICVQSVALNCALNNSNLNYIHLRFFLSLIFKMIVSQKIWNGNITVTLLKGFFEAVCSIMVEWVLRGQLHGADLPWKLDSYSAGQEISYCDGCWKLITIFTGSCQWMKSWGSETFPSKCSSLWSRETFVQLFNLHTSYVQLNLITLFWSLTCY